MSMHWPEAAAKRKKDLEQEQWIKDLNEVADPEPEEEEEEMQIEKEKKEEKADDKNN